MFGRMMAPRRRPILAAMATAALVALVIGFSPVGSLAQQLVRTFRVQQFQAVTVRVPGMNELPQPRELSPAEQQSILELLAPLGTPQTNAGRDTFAEVADQAAARAFFAGYGATLRAPGRLPAAFAGQTPRYGVGKPTSSSYTLNVQVAEQYLAMANLPELNALPWPQGGDQLTFGLDTPAAVATFWGDEARGLGLVQLADLDPQVPGAGPILKLPGELDVAAFRAAVLALPGLPQDTVNQVRNVQNWESTLIIPVPQDATTKNVTIKGAPGLLILDGQGRGALVLWQADGMLFAAGGTVSEAELLSFVNGLAPVR